MVPAKDSYFGLQHIKRAQMFNIFFTIGIKYIAQLLNARN